MSTPVVRVSILRCEAAQFARFRQMMVEAEAVPGLLAYYAGADEATYSLTNTMLDSGKRFAAEGASFERPIINYASLCRFGPLALPEG